MATRHVQNAVGAAPRASWQMLMKGNKLRWATHLRQHRPVRVEHGSLRHGNGCYVAGICSKGIVHRIKRSQNCTIGTTLCMHVWPETRLLTSAVINTMHATMVVATSLAWLSTISAASASAGCNVSGTWKDQGGTTITSTEDAEGAWSAHGPWGRTTPHGQVRLSCCMTLSHCRITSFGRHPMLCEITWPTCEHTRWHLQVAWRGNSALLASVLTMHLNRRTACTSMLFDQISQHVLISRAGDAPARGF
jgi:hypothetical protein